MSEVIHQEAVVSFPNVHLPSLSTLCFHEADANLKLDNNNFCLKSLRLRCCIAATCGFDLSRSRHLGKGCCFNELLWISTEIHWEQRKLIERKQTLAVSLPTIVLEEAKGKGGSGGVSLLLREEVASETPQLLPKSLCFPLEVSRCLKVSFHKYKIPASKSTKSWRDFKSAFRLIIIRYLLLFYL